MKRTKLLVLIIILIATMLIGCSNKDGAIKVGNLYTSGDGKFSEDMEKNASVIVMVSNQSYDVPKVHMSGTVDGLHIFDDKYSVGDQHNVSYYYIYASPGEHVLNIKANDISINENVKIVEGEKLWIFLSYTISENEE